ncbi:hypothetical protein OAK75_00050 [Bacteriovoracales bacterium]|nr:hypothetical protein [Bacteriovoracales bacterium]
MGQDYKNQLDELDTKFSSLKGKDSKTLDFRNFNPMGLHIVAGLPLFRGRFQDFYNDAVNEIKKINPSCVFYSDLELSNSTHITFNSLIRTDCKQCKVRPEEDLGLYKKELNQLTFKKFKIKPLKFYPNGIVLWSTENGGQEVFELRNKVSKILMGKDLKFSKTPSGRPLAIDIIHTAYMKNIQGVSYWNEEAESKLLLKLNEINSDLNRMAIYKEGIVIDSIKLIVEYIKVNENNLDKINKGYQLEDNFEIKGH